MFESRYHNGEYLQNNPSWGAEDSAWKAEKIIDLIKKNNLSPTSVVEVGCGAGEVIRSVWKHFDGTIPCEGYEISEQAYRFCIKKNERNLKYFLDNLFDSKKTFSILLMIDVFEHVPDYLDFLSKAKSCSEYKIFHIPLDMNVSSVLRVSPIQYVRNKVGHLHYFSKETALASLEDTGYEIIDYTYTAGSIEIQYSNLKTKFMSIPRKILFQLSEDLAARLLGGFSLLVLAK